MNSNGTRFPAPRRRPTSTTRAGNAAGTTSSALHADPPDALRLPRLAVARRTRAPVAATPWMLDDHGQPRLSDDGLRLECGCPGRHAPGSRCAPRSTKRTPMPPPSRCWCSIRSMRWRAASPTRLGGSGLVVLWSDGGVQHGLTAVHLRRRWQARCVPFAPRRAWSRAASGTDRAWLLGETQLGLAGAPLPSPTAPPRALRAAADQSRSAAWRGDAGPAAAHGGLLGLVHRRRPSSCSAKPRQHRRTPRACRSSCVRSPHRARASTSGAAGRAAVMTDLAAAGEGRLLPCRPSTKAREPERGATARFISMREDAPAAELVPERWPRRPAAALPAADRFVRHRDGWPRALSADGPVRFYRLAQARFCAQRHGHAEHAARLGDARHAVGTASSSTPASPRLPDRFRRAGRRRPREPACGVDRAAAAGADRGVVGATASRPGARPGVGITQIVPACSSC